MKLVRFNNRIPQTNNLFSQLFGSELINDSDFLSDVQRFNTPKVNIEETDDNYNIEVAAPGFDKKDFNVTVENNVLTIEASKEATKEDKTFSHYEFSYGTFKRSFSLPENKLKESKISANYKNGILNISLPKKDEAKAQPKRLIDIL